MAIPAKFPPDPWGLSWIPIESIICPKCGTKQDEPDYLDDRDQIICIACKVTIHMIIQDDGHYLCFCK